MFDAGIANMYYFYTSGLKSAVNTMIFGMKNTIDSEALLFATKEAVKRYKLFGMKPIIINDSNVMLATNDNEVCVYEIGDSNISFGCAENNQYLFRVEFKDRTLKVSVFHGLGDGRSFCNFCLTLLFYYFTKLGIEIKDSSKILRNGISLENELTFITEDAPFFEMHLQDLKPIFTIPNENNLLNSAYTHRKYITYNAVKLKNILKTFDTTHTVLISILYSDALREIYETDLDISISIPVDMRKHLNSNSITNYCSYPTIILPKIYESDEKRKLFIASKYFASLFDYKYLCSLINNTRNLKNTVMKNNIVDRDAILNRWVEKSNRKNTTTTFCLSNVGLFNIPPEILNHIEYFDIENPNSSPYPIIVLMTVGDKGYIFLTQNFDDDKIIDCFSNKLKKMNIDAIVSDSSNFKSMNLDTFNFEKE